MHIRTGDVVQIMAGKDRGLTGKVIAVVSEKDRVIVEGVNRVVVHSRVGESNKGAKTGGIQNKEAPVHVSNVMLIDPEDSKPTRVGFRREETEKQRADGSTYTAERSVRYSKRSGKEI
ncbi:50S ribosomal protein L24 [Candidatus Nanopelagicales bacterium]|nr:50S ribosomal protein L24 [Candidatus Nanopelagicales bacterium]